MCLTRTCRKKERKICIKALGLCTQCGGTNPSLTKYKYNLFTRLTGFVHTKLYMCVNMCKYRQAFKRHNSPVAMLARFIIRIKSDDFFSVKSMEPQNIFFFFANPTFFCESFSMYFFLCLVLYFSRWIKICKSDFYCLHS